MSNINNHANQKKHLPIRSFAPRQGRVTLGQRWALTHLWKDYVVENNKELIDLPLLFNRAAPVILEIGFGNGEALMSMAQAHPDLNFIGAEVYRPGIGVLLAHLHQQQIANIKIFYGDAVELLKNNITDGSLHGVHIFFPDPWHKRRHHKRRLVQHDFCQLVANKLKPASYLHLATDWQDYAQQMMQVVSSVEAFENPQGVGQFAARPDYRPLTKFEKRGQRLGHGVWDIIVNKR